MIKVKNLQDLAKKKNLEEKIAKMRMHSYQSVRKMTSCLWLYLALLSGEVKKREVTLIY